MHDEAVVMEPLIKKKLSSIAKLLGFEFKAEDTNIKSIESITNKIDASGINFNDVLRFTFTTDNKTFTKKSSKMLRVIRDEGMYVKRWRNAFLETRTTYLGINIDIQYGNYIFELQLHTDDSYAFRNGEDHDRYKALNNPNLTTDEALELMTASFKEYRLISHPDNVELLTLEQVKKIKEGRL